MSLPTLTDCVIIKRDGRKEPMTLEKYERVIEWAASGLNVSASHVMLEASKLLQHEMTTDELHQTITKVCADLISTDYPDYQYMAARMAMFRLRKIAYGHYQPPHIYDHVKRLVGLGKYDSALMSDYSKEDFDYLNSKLIHKRDENFAYAAVKQLEGKYLVQNRVSGEIYETPQMLYMLVGASLYSDYSKSVRLEKIVRFYNAVSTFKLSLPTPIMAGARTPTRQFSSCVLIEVGDSLDSISAASTAIVKYVSQRAGIGLNVGAIRAQGSEIRGGEAFHTGCVPFYKHFQSAVKSCSQGGVRGGAATLFYPLWHLEVESLLVLKNNRGVEDNRVRHLDYAVQMNKLMYQRLIKNKDITLFSPDAVPGLYDAFFSDQEKFERLYTEAENNHAIRQKRIKAADLYSVFAQERASTGRIYLQNVDHCNNHSPFIASVAPIRQSNLCLEIALPTKPVGEADDPDGEIALCTLSAFNLSAIDSLDELEELADIAVEALNQLLDYQAYPLPGAKKSSLGRRTLGVGAINFANYLAKNGVKYSDGSANRLVHETFEAMQYYLIKASMEQAKVHGPCPLFHETTYSKGIMPVDTYMKKVDEIVDNTLLLDWDGLAEAVVKYGMRNSTLSALMPSETSSQISNSTNGIEPPRGFVSVKSSKDGLLKQVVPDYEELKDSYELLWDIPNNKGYLELVAIMQKFIDQTISANTNYDPSKFENNKVPMKTILSDMLYSYQLGVKTLYYHNTRDSAGEDGQTVSVPAEDPNDCGTACKI